MLSSTLDSARRMRPRRVLVAVREKLMRKDLFEDPVCNRSS
jgi:hypothetical protein